MRKCTKRAVSWMLAIVMLFSMSGVAMAAETELSEEPAVTAEVEAAENPELTDTSEALEGDIGDFDETEAAETGVVEKAEPEDADEAELEEQEALDSSYRHLCKLRDEVIAMGVLPPVADWHRLNHNID